MTKMPRRTRLALATAASAVLASVALLVPQAAVADTVIDTVPSAGLSPWEAVASPDGSHVYVGNWATSTIGVIDTATNTQVGSIAIGANLINDLAISPDSMRLYAVSRSFGGGGGNLVAIDTATGTVIGSQRVVPGTFSSVAGVAVSPDGARIYATVWPDMAGTGTTPGTLYTIDAATLQPIRSVPVGLQPRLITLTPDGGRAYIANTNSNTVSLVDLSTNTVVATVPVGASPWGATISPDGNSVYVTNNVDNTVSVIDVATNAVTATIPAGSGPRQVAFTPDGSRAYVVDRAGNAVTVIDTVAQAVVSTIPVGSLPAGIAITPDGLTAYVGNGADNTVSIIALDTFPAITTTTLPDGTNGTAYSSTIVATGRPAPTLAVTSGTLPPGLTLDPVTGALTGTPTTAGVYTFTVTASSTVSGIPATASRTYTITIPAPEPTPTPTPAPTSTSAPTSGPTDPAQPSPAGATSLADTGTDVTPLIASGLLLLLGGGLLAWLRRPWPPTQTKESPWLP